MSESMFSSGAAELVEDLGTGGVGCVTATGEDIQIRRKAKVRVRLALCAFSSSSPASVPVTFEALVAPDVRFSLLSLGLLLKKGWSVSFGSEPRVFGPKVSRGRPRSELRVEGFQNCFWLVCSTGSTPQVTAVMPEISAPPASSSVCTLPQLPDGIQFRLRERVASTRQEGGPTVEGVRVGDSRVGSEGRRVRSDRVGEGSTGFEGRDSRARASTEGSRGSAPATAASGTEDTATGARGRVCGSGGGGGANASEGSPKGRGSLKGSIGKQSVGKIKGKGPKAAASGKLDSNMPKIKAQPKPPQVKAAPKRPSAPASSSKGPGTKAGAVNLVPKGVGKVHLKPCPDSLKSNPPLGRRWSAYPRKRKGRQQGKQQKATAESSTQTPEIMTVMGHAERHEKLEEEAKSFAQPSFWKGMAAPSCTRPGFHKWTSA